MRGLQWDSLDSAWSCLGSSGQNPSLVIDWISPVGLWQHPLDSLFVPLVSIWILSSDKCSKWPTQNDLRSSEVNCYQHYPAFNLSFFVFTASIRLTYSCKALHWATNVWAWLMCSLIRPTKGILNHSNWRSFGWCSNTMAAIDPTVSLFIRKQLIDKFNG